MTRPLEGKSALVTGGSRGIGAAIAQRLACDGAAVTLTYVGSRDTAEAVVQTIADAGGAARAIQADAGQPGAGARAVADAIEHQGGLDILVSNAGVNIAAPVQELDDEAYETVFGVNVRGTLDVIRAASREMKSGGRIVVVTATIANSFFAPGLGLYGASKAAANAFVQGWCRDLGPHGITINAVVPGPIDTAMNPKDTALADHLRAMVPLGRYGQAEEVAALTAFLVGPEAAFITGARLIIDGGLTA
jgi:NAD(P)-dependent dehydrogenase (short-subunit alcohol dehydrogenase family)